MSFNYKPSFWAQDLAPRRTEALSSHVKADVAIVGGGFAGLSAAHYIKQAKPDLDVVVLEAEHTGFASNGRNFGVVCPGIREMADPNTLDPAEAESIRFVSEWLLAERRELEGRIRNAGIDADFREEPTLVEALDEVEKTGLQRMSQVFDGRGTPHRLLGEEEMRECVPYPAKSGLVLEAWRLVQPWRLARGIRDEVLSQEVKLYEGTRVDRIEPGAPAVVHTEAGGSVTAGKVVVATNAYTPRLQLPGLPEKLVYAMHTHVIATEKLDAGQRAELGFNRFQCVIGSGMLFYYQRVYDDRLLLGGGTEMFKPSTLDTAADQREDEYVRLQAELVRRFPFLKEVKIDTAWGGPVALTRSGLPIVMELPEAQNVILSVGCNGEGITLMNAAGKQVQGLVLGERYTDTDAERVRQYYVAGLS